jgi:hypothetical protein
MTWRVAESLETLRRQFDARFPTRSKASDGGIGDAAHASRDSDHNPWVKDGAMGIVTARDFTHDPYAGMDIDRLTNELAASRDNRIKYIIANGWILDTRPGNNPWRWVRYYGSNPHTKHFHLSVMPSKSLYDDARPWNLPSLRIGGGGSAPPSQEEADMTPEQADQLDYAVRIGVENQRRIDALPDKIWRGVTVYRDGKKVPALQELADAKSQALANGVENAALRQLVAERQGVSEDRIAEIVRDAVQQHIKITGTVDIGPATEGQDA